MSVSRESCPRSGRKRAAVLREQLDNSLSLDCDVIARELESPRPRPRHVLTGTSVD